MRALTLIIHGDWGSGKSWAAQTSPAPRLVLDAEGGAEFTFGKKIKWENANDPPPKMDGYDTCVLRVDSMKTLRTAAQWLQSGKHPFASVIIDSLSEIQKRMVDDIAGSAAMRIQDYGELFRNGEALVRSFRDLKYHPTKPLQCIVYVAGTVERGVEDVKLMPYVQGQLSKTLSGFVDIVGLVRLEREGDSGLRHVMYVRPLDGYVAKDRTHTFLEGEIDFTRDEDTGVWRNTIETMMARVDETLTKREKEGKA